MLENEKSCTLKYKSCLKFFAKPAPAFAAYIPDNIPNNNENIVNQLIEVFGLKEENGISRIAIKNDNSWHYRYLEDKS